MVIPAVYCEKMFSYMLDLMDSEKDIIVTTYRANVPERIPARMFYKKMGFAEGKLREEFGTRFKSSC